MCGVCVACGVCGVRCVWRAVCVACVCVCGMCVCVCVVCVCVTNSGIQQTLMGPQL